MKVRRCILCIALLLICNSAANADIFFHFEGVGDHATYYEDPDDIIKDPVSVDFGILDPSINDWDDVLGINDVLARMSFYDAVYISNDPRPGYEGFNTTDSYYGNVQIYNDLAFSGYLRMVFPNNPLPGAGTGTSFLVMPSGPDFRYSWSPHPYNYSLDTSFEILDSDPRNPIPEPTTLSLLGLGLLGLLFKKKIA